MLPTLWFIDFFFIKLRFQAEIHFFPHSEKFFIWFELAEVLIRSDLYKINPETKGVAWLLSGKNYRESRKVVFSTSKDRQDGGHLNTSLKSAVLPRQETAKTVRSKGWCFSENIPRCHYLFRRPFRENWKVIVKKYS